MLSPRTARHLAVHYPQADVAIFRRKLEAWRVAGSDGWIVLERERLIGAVLIAGGGSRQEVQLQIELAEVDWRDALVNGGLADKGWERRLDEVFGPAS